MGGGTSVGFWFWVALVGLSPRVRRIPAAQKGDQQAQGGLSPRVRGNRRRIDPIAVCVRSIPACAGEPELPEDPREIREVYPRVCGGTPHRKSLRT